jgi:RHS repeat-associated protein
MRGFAGLAAYSYTYTPDGSQISRTYGAQNTAYEYDWLGRLVKEDKNDWQCITYGYDRFSNRSKMTVAGYHTPGGSKDEYTTDYEYDANNRLRCEKKREKRDRRLGEAYFYRYDPNGAQVRREWERIGPAMPNTPRGKIGFVRGDEIEGGATLDLREYNGYGQLVYVSRDGVSTEYRYRPDGLRHSQTVWSAQRKTKTQTVFYWDGQNTVLETNGQTGRIRSRYLRGANLVCQVIDLSLMFYFFNAHGDVVKRVSGQGDATPLYDYDAFGSERKPIKNDPNPFRYCGEYWDAAIGEIYLRARTYDPVNGRFSSEDPARNGLNWYGYCGGNPISFADSSGASAELVEILSGLSAFAAAIFASVGTVLIAIAIVIVIVVIVDIIGMIADSISKKRSEEEAERLAGISSPATPPGPRRPGNNQHDNEQAERAANEANLSTEGRERLHRDITGKGYNYEEILEIARSIAEMGGKYVNSGAILPPIIAPRTPNNASQTSQPNSGTSTAYTPNNVSNPNAASESNSFGHKAPASSYTGAYSNYTVQPGDSFWAIAASKMGSGMSMYDLAAYNGMSVNSTIHPGQLLKVPK